MDYNFPKLHFDRTRYLSLNEAFHLLGAYKFPSEWTGLEISAWPELKTSDLRAEKDRLNDKATFAQRVYGDIRKEPDTHRDQETYDEHQTRLVKARKNADLAKSGFSNFLKSFDCRISDASAFERKQSIEADLIQAMRSIALKTYLDSGFVHGSMPTWLDQEKFCISFVHSYVIVPERNGPRNRYRAYFLKSAFDTWTAELQRQIVTYRTASLEDDLIEWYKRYIQEQDTLAQRATHKMVETACRESFTRADEARGLDKMLDAIWDLYAPELWRGGGKGKTIKPK